MPLSGTYSWTENAAQVVITVPLKGVARKDVDIYCTLFLKPLPSWCHLPAHLHLPLLQVLMSMSRSTMRHTCWPWTLHMKLTPQRSRLAFELASWSWCCKRFAAFSPCTTATQHAALLRRRHADSPLCCFVQATSGLWGADKLVLKGDRATLKARREASIAAQKERDAALAKKVEEKRYEDEQRAMKSEVRKESSSAKFSQVQPSSASSASYTVLTRALLSCLCLLLLGPTP